jgi:hypothetical protein
MKRKILLAVLAAACLLGLAVNLRSVALCEAALAREATWRFLIGGYDPLDPFSGRFIQFRIRALETVRGFEGDEAFTGIGKGDGFYGRLARDGEGYGYLSAALNREPEGDEAWLRMRYLGDGRVEPLFDRYYVNEALADEYDRKMAEARPGEAFIRVKIARGVGVITGLDFAEER